MVRHVTWGSVPNAVQYHVKITTDGGTTVVQDSVSPLLATQFTAAGGKTYTIEVDGVDAGGVHGPTATAVWVEPQPPVTVAPPNLQVV